MNFRKAPALTAFGRPTFYGMYQLFKEQLAREYGWNTETATSYNQIYTDTIIPNLNNHDKKPMDTYTREDFDLAIAAIKRKGYQIDGIRRDYEQETLDRYLRLMRVVVEIAASNYRCCNCFADKTSNNSILSRKSHPTIIPKAMTPEQETRTGQALLTNPMQSGEYMGLCSMFCLGLRNAEACALNFGDIRLWNDVPGLYVAWIYKTTIIGSNQLKSGGKTRNADRVVILPDRYVKLVLERKKHLQELLGENCNVDNLPIACKGNSYFKRCSADALTAAAKKLFYEVGILPEQIYQAYKNYLLDMDDADPIKQLVYLDLEKDPTAYYLRRVTATAWIDVGLSESQVEFMIGHDISDSSITRTDFMTTERLLEIQRIVNQRAIVNDGYFKTQEALLSPNSVTPVHHVGKKTFHIPAGSRQVTIQMAAREFFDFICVAIDADNPVNISYHQFNVPQQEPSSQINTLEAYHSLYIDPNK